jgi:ribosomal protein S18 acetylase RimI-like enzyme
VEIIRAKKEHTQQIMEVWQEFIQFHMDAEPLWNPGEDALKDFQKQLKKQMKSANALVLVAIEQGRVAGFAVSIIGSRPPLYRLPKYGTISDMGIKSEYRHKGAGEKMLEEIMRWFMEKGVTLAEVTVMAKNEVAGSFWAKHGFQDFSHRMCRLVDKPVEH